MPDVRDTGRTARLAIDATCVAVAAVILVAIAYQVWDADLGIPFVYLERDHSPWVYAPDAPFYLMMAKGALDHGWFLTNPSLGFPFGQQLYDLPHGMDNLNLLILRALLLVFGNPFVAVNVFYLLTFAGVAASAFLVARRLGVSRLASGAVALLYAFLPYHFARGTPHLLLSAYWMVPVAALLLVAVTSDRPAFTAPMPEGGWKVALRDRFALWWFLACAGLASTGTYYAAITITLLVPLVVIDFLARRRRQVLAAGGMAVAAILAVAALNLLPTFVYWVEHGRNTELVKRGPSETEVNGLKISQLVLPVEGHRLRPFAEIQADSTRFTVIDAERGQQLGLIGAAGFIGLLGAVLLAARRQVRAADRGGPGTACAGAWSISPGDVLRVFGVATVTAIVVAAVSGFALVMAGVGLSDIRSWNRVSVFIGYFALVAVGFGIDWVRSRLPDRPWRRPAVVAAVGALVVVGVLDQFAPRDVPDYEATRRRFDSDARFFQRVERTLPAGAAVFNLPYLFFPESGTVNGLGPYDNARGYLHTKDLRWSWGGVVGTEVDWAAGAAQSPPAEMLDRITALGFRGLVLDRRGYGPDGLREAFLTETAGPPAFESPRGDLAFYDLRRWATEARRRLGPEGIRAKRREALRDHGLPRALG